MSFQDDRGAVLDLLRATLIGPRSGQDETVEDPPSRLYAMGVLFPVETSRDALEAEEPNDVAAGSAHVEDLADDEVSTFSSWMPSSCGLSLFLVGPPRIEVGVRGSAYDLLEGPAEGQGRRSRSWRRRPLVAAAATEALTLSPEEPEAPALEGRAQVRSLWRRLGEGWLVTVSLLNAESRAGDSDPSPESCIYQVGLAVRPDGGGLAEYPKVENLTRDPEEEELRLVHRRRRVFAVGHNCSVDWDRDETAAPSAVYTEFLPAVEVPAVTAEARCDHPALHLAWLADPDRPTQVLQQGLLEFVEDYRAWIAEQVEETVPSHLRQAKDRLTAAQAEALVRIEEGVTVLAEPDVAEAFRLANRAMLMQMRHAKSDLGGGSRPLGEALHEHQDYGSFPYAWRPFQLAFQLLVLPSLIDPEREDRAVVDLLWFPTGGGKTEAYLGLTAFVILLRRLRHRTAGTGTAVITRYTLRLLTTQQFQRAASLICACEHLRRDDPGRLGDQEISLGLWLGGEVTPNSFGGEDGAIAKTDAVLHSKEPKSVYPFQLDRCPWCGTEIVPDRKQESTDAYGVTVENDSLRLRCPSPGCAFSHRLPVLVVDEEIYRTPPTFLVSTVDKFARLAWVEGAGSLFGSESVLPPTMVIQDELHLLSGPLGTTVGVYEAAVDTLIELKGAPPKVIASTATIRRAGDQIRGLYGSTVRLFPPSGLDADDSFFARPDRTRPGRLYAGVMTPSHTTAMAVRLSVAPLLAAPLELALDPTFASSYWTIVVYHNSLRELGRTITIARDDIPAHLRVVAADPKRVRPIADEDVVELTSNVPARELPVILRRMSLGRGEPEAISVLTCTNMLSVGIDVPRLAVMVVNGQPKTTSEYIQATSRVGRAAVPGLVIALLSATKPRDRSHYEGFVAFHQALYRHVEPTSVTPYSSPSRSRSLHAALAIVVRHGAGLSGNADAQAFRREDPRVDLAMRLLADRAAAGDPSEADETRHALEELALEWEARAEGADRFGPPLRYQSSSRAMQSLLVDFQSGREGWETLHSMRNVDLQVAIDV